MLIKDNVLFGLTPEEVTERVNKNEVNITPNRKTKTYREIIFKNVFSVFNLVILVMGIMVIPTIKSIGDITNIAFLLIAFLNLFIGIFQEVKAKKTVDKLILVNEAKVKVLRNLETKEIGVSEIVLDDTMFLEAGKQICADAKMIRGEIYVNESNLTGEADDILKKEGDELFSGSYVISGEGYANVIHVGKDNYIEKLSSQVTKYAKPTSEIMKSLNAIITTISLCLIPLSIMLFIVYHHYSAYISSDIVIFGLSRELVLGLVSAINGMIPYGLFLLTSISLAASVVRLAKSKTLVQELYCIESLARVDCLCLDKTGTLTDGTMTVNDFEIINKKYSVLEIISSMNAALKNNNQTSAALKDKFTKKAYYEPLKVLNFNSTNKFSAVSFRGVGTFALGAPEILMGKVKKNDPLLKDINRRASEGNRVILLTKTTSKIKDNTLAGPFEPISLISIHDNLRKGVNETLKEFEENGVMIKIISGDNPITVSAISKDAGVPDADKYISLADLTDKEVEEAALKYCVFGRVKPNQKKIIIETLKHAGHKVAMTGDGVNDILALREADCSIAMASGSDAVKTISHLVLLDSNFLSLPKVVNEGRKVINNIERTSALYLAKTILMAFINVFAVVMYFVNPSLEFTSPYKEPSQLFMIETLIIALPSLILAFEDNKERIKGHFFTNVLRASLPGALIVFLNLIVIRFFFSGFGVGDLVETNVSIIVSTLTFYMILILISLPFSKLRLITALVVLLLILVVPLISLFTKTVYGFDFFHFAYFSGSNLLAFSVKGLEVSSFLLGADAVIYTTIILLFFSKKKSKKWEVKK